MSKMRIAVVDRTEQLNHSQVKKAVRAINRQLKEDFYPAWHINALCCLVSSKTEIETVKDHAVIFLRDRSDSDDQDILGYHDRVLETGLPYGYVFLDVSDKLDEAWTTSFSHEVLELIGNRHCNYYALGPHPKLRNKSVLHWLEMCDAVQDNVYSIDRIDVSDFVLPHYFTPEHERDRPVSVTGASIPSFGVDKGGYVGFLDPRTGKEENFFADGRARMRHRIKARCGTIRRRVRFSKLVEAI